MAVVAHTRIQGYRISGFGSVQIRIGRSWYPPASAFASTTSTQNRYVFLMLLYLRPPLKSKPIGGTELIGTRRVMFAQGCRGNPKGVTSRITRRIRPKIMKPRAADAPQKSFINDFFFFILQVSQKWGENNNTRIWRFHTNENIKKLKKYLFWNGKLRTHIKFQLRICNIVGVVRLWVSILGWKKSISH